MAAPFVNPPIGLGYSLAGIDPASETPGLGTSLVAGLPSQPPASQLVTADPTDQYVTVSQYAGLHNPFDHAGISVNGGPAYGLDPAFDIQEPSPFPVPGLIEPVASDRQIEDQVRIPVTKAQAQQIQQYMLDNSGPMLYDFLNRNCSTFVGDALRSAGVKAPAYPASITPAALLWSLHRMYDKPQGRR